MFDTVVPPPWRHVLPLAAETALSCRPSASWAAGSASPPERGALERTRRSRCPPWESLSDSSDRVQTEPSIQSLCDLAAHLCRLPSRRAPHHVLPGPGELSGSRLQRRRPRIRVSVSRPGSPSSPVSSENGLIPGPTLFPLTTHCLGCSLRLCFWVKPGSEVGLFFWIPVCPSGFPLGRERLTLFTPRARSSRSRTMGALTA